MTAATHWSVIRERGSLAGLKTLLTLYKYGGRYLVVIALYPIIGYFFITGKEARSASLGYLNRLHQYGSLAQKPTMLLSFKHFLAMGFSALDKVDVWLGKITLKSIIYSNHHIFESLLKKKQGALIIGSHLGNLEVCRALSDGKYSTRFNVLVFTENAQKFNEFINSINENVSVNLIEVKEIGPDLAISLKERIDNGEYVVIAGDRTSTTVSTRAIQQEFLGEEASFAQGPFILAGIMQCPILTMFCLKEENNYRICLDLLSEPIHWSRKTRQAELARLVENYAKTLEKYCAQYPLQWFNYFDFWQKDNAKEVK